MFADVVVTRRDGGDRRELRGAAMVIHDPAYNGRDAAGVPRSVWSMHARHGGATEAQQAGVDLADIAEHAQHSDINTTRKTLHRAIGRDVEAGG